MKLVTSSFKVTVFSNGKFCWINPRWEEKSKNEIASDLAYSILINLFLGAILLLA